MPTTVTALAANVGLEVTGLSGPDLVNRSSASTCLALAAPVRRGRLPGSR